MFFVLLGTYVVCQNTYKKGWLGHVNFSFHCWLSNKLAVLFYIVVFNCWVKFSAIVYRNEIKLVENFRWKKVTIFFRLVKIHKWTKSSEDLLENSMLCKIQVSMNLQGWFSISFSVICLYSSKFVIIKLSLCELQLLFGGMPIATASSSSYRTLFMRMCFLSD